MLDIWKSSQYGISYLLLFFKGLNKVICLGSIGKKSYKDSKFRFQTFISKQQFVSNIYNITSHLLTDGCIENIMQVIGNDKYFPKNMPY